MERLGATDLLVCSNVGADPIDDELAAEQLSLVADLAAEHGMRVAYEALAWARHVNVFEHAWRIVEMADHPALGACLDSFHILSRGSEPEGTEKIPGDKIFILQLADAPVMSMGVLQWSRHYRSFPGQGGLDVVGLTAHVLRAGYDGPLSLEVFNDVFRQSPAKRTAVDAFRSLVALEEAVLFQTERSGMSLPGSITLHRPHRLPSLRTSRSSSSRWAGRASSTVCSSTRIDVCGPPASPRSGSRASTHRRL